jgi:Sigma-54 interaction domain
MESLIGTSEAMTKLRRLLPKVARSEATVLITRESGTGKEKVAELIHQMSAVSYPNFADFLSRVTNAFGQQFEPSLLTVRSDVVSALQGTDRTPELSRCKRAACGIPEEIAPTRCPSLAERRPGWSGPESAGQEASRAVDSTASES